MTSATSEKPELAIFHALARTGCTIFSRYLGAMDGVLLLSEIHPDGPVVGKTQTEGKGHLALNAVVQAAAHGLEILEDPNELLTVGAEPNSLELLTKVIAATKSAGRVPVFRDWSHIDWHGLPFCKPTGGGALAALLEPHFTLKRGVWVRHPLACYLSLASSPTLGEHYRDGPALEHYVQGWLGFIDANPMDHVVRYEDFLPDPAAAVAKMSAYLGLTFDPDFAAKVEGNRTVTGDDRAKEEAALSLFQRPMPPALWAQIRSFGPYQELMARLGYALDELPLGYTL